MDPIARFVELLEQAKQTPGITEPTGMTLSTVGADGRQARRHRHAVEVPDAQVSIDARRDARVRHHLDGRPIIG